MNGYNGDVTHPDSLRERKKPPYSDQVGKNNAGEKIPLLKEDNQNKKTFGKTPDGAGE